jgi:predicted 2-oxoglutarate/Fe(II)-dependent dioxygenase YbiX/peroxiredoxin
MDRDVIAGPGERVANFSLVDQDNTRRSFYHEVRGGPILLVLASDATAEVARATLAFLQDQAARFEEAGIETYAVVRGDRLAASVLARSLELPFTVFADPQGEVVGRYLDTAAQRAGAGASARLLALDSNQRIVALADGVLDKAGLARLEAALAAAAPPQSETPVTIGWPAPALVLPRVLDPNFCAELIDLWRDEHHEGGFSTGRANTYDPDKKKTLEHVITDPELVRRLNVTLARRISPELAKVFNFRRPFQFDAPVVMSYQPERQDFFGLHRDDLRPRNPRIFAMSLNLNDDFEGGELVFPEYSPHGYKMPAGAACIFACGLLHAARPVTRGQRFVLTNFFCATEPRKAGTQGPRHRQVQL